VVGLIAATFFLASLVLIHPPVSADTGTGSVSLNTVGAPVTENFDTLSNTAGSTTNTTLPTGWYITEQGGGARDNEQYGVDTGGSGTGDIYSYGAAASTDRALGALRSGTLIPFYGAKFANNTGVTITSLDVSYIGEEWRLGTAARTDRIDFQISTNATDLTTGTYTDVDTLDFTTPDTVTAGAKNGNAAADRTAISATISSLSIPNGASFFIRWIDLDASGADDGLSVDDFSLTPQTGPVTPTLNINDVTQAETNAGTTTFTFTVSLTSPAAGDVTFDIATADGTAQDGNPGGEDNDYVAKTETGRTITSGNTSAVFTVTVNGDTTPEPNETFFVNVTNITGANAGDVLGLGTINNDDVTITPIHTIQGSGSTSPLAGSVTTAGIVTGLKSNGFFIQEPDATVDADPNTSEGIFVFTSSAPPAAAVIGNNVQVTGTVQEFIPSQDPNSPPATELITPTVGLLSTGNPLPAPILITGAETTQASETTNPLDSLEEYEGMRVTVASLTVTGATQGTITEPSATVSSSGVFIGVVTGVARPFREQGIAVSDPLPAGAPVTIPRFDENPERIRVDSDAQPGTTPIDVAAGTIITNITGPLDYAFRCYTIDPDAATPPIVGVQPGSTPVPAATADEFTVVSFNMERFFDTVNDPATSDPVLTAVAFNRRLAKASLIIRTVQRYPDVIGVEEMENLTTLQAVANQINTDAVNIDALPNPNYTAYLSEGNDIGGIDVGFLVKQSRIGVVDVTQFGLADTFTNPDSSTSILNDRPPLVLRATCPRPLGGSLPFTVIVNHLRSLNGVDDTTAGSNGFATEGERVRFKRRAQAEYLANLIQTRQVADPTELIITLGDMNAFAVNDGYVDSIGTIKGTPAPASQVTLASTDLVNPDLTDLIDILPAAQQYSYNFDGNAQTLDHIILNHKALVFLTRFAYARNDSDFAVKDYESTNELRISDHDQPVAYFNLTLSPTAANGVVSGRVTDPNGAPIAGAVVNLSGTQNRKSITDANGSYRFDGVETSGFYTVRPSSANYSFSPAERSFSQIGNSTQAAFTGSPVANGVNAIDTAEYFVRQHYLDFLGREPDESGFNFWSDQILECGNDAACVERRTINVSAAYFLSIEFQQTGGLVDGLYRTSYGVRPQFAEFMPDTATLARDVVVGRTGWEQLLTANKQAFLADWVNRPAFRAAYDLLTDDRYVDALIAHTGVNFTASERDALVNGLTFGTLTRGGVLQRIAEDERFVAAKRDETFVMMEYFGYLRRDPDASGFQFWLNKLNQFGGNFEQAEMVKAFIVSGEYRSRFVR
jgi:predicted extracellular nuclease